MKCTYCGGTQFYNGPSGGMSTNILCANPECRHWFNYTEMFGTMDDLDKIEPTKEEKQTEWEKMQLAEKEAKVARYIVGQEAYKKRENIETLRTDPAYGSYAGSANNIDRICGYISAMRADINLTKIDA